MIETGNILVIEDDKSMGFLITEFLESEGFRVKLCQDGTNGLDAIKNHTYDLCLLDIMMPEMDGFSLAHQIKNLQQGLSFIFLTARSLKEDKLKGFALGAEDYITKPFDEEELLCRIRVVLRRKMEVKTQAENRRFVLGDYIFDYHTQELKWKTLKKWRLTETENEVLLLLCLHQNQILRRDAAVEKIYGKRDYFLGRSFDVFISKMRKMLQLDPRIQIENVFGVGFIFSVPT